jgi:hypothetical protein
MTEVPGVATAWLWAASLFPYLASAVFGIRPWPAPGIGTVAVDESWRLWVDAEVCAGWSPAQFGSVLVHHVCRLLRKHGQRARAAGVVPDDAACGATSQYLGIGGAVGYEPGRRSRSVRWIRCADAEINDDLVPADLELPRPVLPHPPRAPAPSAAAGRGRATPAVSSGCSPGRRGWYAAWPRRRSCGMPARSAPCPPG